MTAIPYIGGIYRGTDAERTGGTWTNLDAGWLFITSDTKQIYYWTGSAWVHLGPLTTLGDILYRGSSDLARLAGNTTTTKKLLSQTGDGTNSAAPAWSTLVFGDLPLDPVVAITNTNSPYSILSTHDTILINAGSGAVIATLPTAVGVTGKKYNIKRTDNLASSNLVMINTTSSQTISGTSSYYLWPGEYIIVKSDGANWEIVSRTPISNQGTYFRKGTAADRWYLAGIIGGSAVTVTTTTAPAINTLWALPFIVGKTTKFDTIAFNLTTAQASAQARLGIYRDDGNLYPNALVFDSGAIDAHTATGALKVTITSNLQVLPAGLYWLTWECDTANLQLVGLSGGGNVMGILGTSTGLNTANGYGYSVAHTFGSLPDPYTSSASVLTTAPSASVPIPGIYIRAI